MEGSWSLQKITNPDPGGPKTYESYQFFSEFGSWTILSSVMKVFFLLIWYFWSRHPRETWPTRVWVPFPVWSARSLFVGSGRQLLYQDFHLEEQSLEYVFCLACRTSRVWKTTTAPICFRKLYFFASFLIATLMTDVSMSHRVVILAPGWNYI